ncbi:uncharacterized protein LOC134322038 [Trichomycterus rosablanca]|uniref:uncharacterized protein LOC134322038 n=1 Tax=Trichomycterus rosablanca TaxID=2290929 RepID=UPI002F34FFAD
MAVAKMKSKKLCKTVQAGNLRNLSPEDLGKANEVKAAALEILQDALNKELYVGDPPKFYPSCTLDKDPRRYCAVLTKEFLEQMIEKMKKVRFLKDPEPEEEGIIAYVKPDDETCTVHLCPVFWMLSDRLSRDSKPGSLIHEVSHFLGTEDATYDFVCIETHENMGCLLGAAVAYVEDEKEGGMKVHSILGGSNTELFSKKNANNIEYEFEIILNHRVPYSTEDEKYRCCGETRINSVCPERDIHYYIHRKKPY